MSCLKKPDLRVKKVRLIFSQEDYFFGPSPSIVPYSRPATDAEGVHGPQEAPLAALVQMLFIPFSCLISNFAFYKRRQHHLEWI